MDTFGNLVQRCTGRCLGDGKFSKKQIYFLVAWKCTKLSHCLCIFQTSVLQKDCGAPKRPGIISKTRSENDYSFDDHHCSHLPPITI